MVLRSMVMVVFLVPCEKVVFSPMAILQSLVIWLSNSISQ